MRTTAPGERVLQSIEIHNPTNKRQTFEVVLPNPLISWIKIAPYIVDLAPQQRQRLEVTQFVVSPQQYPVNIILPCQYHTYPTNTFYYHTTLSLFYFTNTPINILPYQHPHQP